MTASVVAATALVGGTAHAVAAGPPDGRGYERVSAADTGGAPAFDGAGGTTEIVDDDTIMYGNGVTPQGSAPSGADPAWLATRTASGWVDTSLEPASTDPYQQYKYLDATHGFGASVWFVYTSETQGGSVPSERAQSLRYRDAAGNFTTIVSDPVDNYGFDDAQSIYGGMSADGQSVVYETYTGTAFGAPAMPEVYLWHPNGSSTLLSTGDLRACGATVPGGTYDAAQTTNAVSADGQTRFFQSTAGGSGPGCPTHPQLYVSQGDTTTEISVPSSGAADPAAPEADFLGASPDGRTAYFVSQAALTADVPAGSTNKNLFEWRAGAGLRCVTCADGLSLGNPTSAALLPATAAVAPQGNVVWFPDASGQLHAWDGQELIAASVPNSGVGSTAFAIAPDGTAAIVRTSSEASDVYRVALDGGAASSRCISCVNGTTGQVRIGLAYAPFETTSPRGASTLEGIDDGAITADDDTAVFTSTAQLTPDAAPNTDHAYEWRAGAGLSLIADHTDVGVGITPDGHDVFFGSSSPLTVDATQTTETLYDARVGGGFSPPAVATPCQGNACSGPQRSPSPPAVGSAARSDGNVRPPTIGRLVLSASVRSRLVHRGRATVTIGASGSGDVVLSVTERIGRRSRLITHRHVRAAGRRLRVVVALDAAGRRALRSGHSVRLTLRVAPTQGHRRQVTVTLSPPDRSGQRRSYR